VRPVLVVLVSVLLALASASDARADRLLLESYAGNRLSDAERVAPLVREVFTRRGFIADLSTLRVLLREHTYRPGVATPGFDAVLRRQVGLAATQLSEEKFDLVAANLGKVIDQMRQNSFVVAHDQKLRDEALHALVFYALACSRRAQLLSGASRASDAALAERLRDEALNEVARSFPPRSVNRFNFGREAEDLASKAFERIDRVGRGRLLISVDPRATVYVNEVVQRATAGEIGNLLPGVYRVLVEAPTGESRLYEVSVSANQTARLTINWEADALLTAGAGVALHYLSEKEFRFSLEAQVIGDLARQHTDAIVAATMTIARAHGRFVVIATSYDVAKRRALRRGKVELAGSASDEQTLDHLVDHIMRHDVIGVIALPIVDDEVPPPPLSASPAPAPDLTPSSMRPGPVAMRVPEPGSEAASKPTSALPPAGPALPADAPALAPAAPATATAGNRGMKWLAAGGAVAAFGLGALGLYLDYGCFGADCRYEYTNAGLIGYTSLGVGVGLASVATYLFIRDARASGSPRLTLSPTLSGAMVRWSADF
jgi:hypothetical protein